MSAECRATGCKKKKLDPGAKNGKRYQDIKHSIANIENMNDVRLWHHEPPKTNPAIFHAFVQLELKWPEDDFEAPNC